MMMNAAIMAISMCVASPWGNQGMMIVGGPYTVAAHALVEKGDAERLQIGARNMPGVYYALTKQGFEKYCHQEPATPTS